jgi:penicillin-binding protein 1A
VAFDVQSAGMLALVGGVDYARNQFNRALYAKRQSGSAIKPFIYAAAIDKGFTPASIILDTPLTYKSDEFDEGWRPKNYENKYFGPTSLRTGLVMSRNVVTVKILKQIGLSYAIDYLRRFDMDAQLPRNLSLALGTGVVTPYGLTKGYGVFAVNGWPFEPTLITSISSHDGATNYFQAIPRPIRELPEEQPPADAAIDPDGTVETDLAPDADPDAVDDVPPDTTIDAAGDASLAVGEGSSGVAPEAIQEVPSIISEQTAYIITNIMTDVVREGTGWRVKALGRPVAGKTGSSDDFKDAWFIGYTPATLCGVWVGYDDSIPLGPQEAGGKAAAPIFLDFMSQAVADLPAADFRVPVGIVFAQVDRQTGLIAAQASENTQFECFKEQSLPAKQDSAPEDLMLKEVF